MADLPKDIIKDIDGFKETKADTNLKDNPELDIEKELHERRSEELDLMKEQWEIGGKKGRQPKLLSTLLCKAILEEYFSFALFDIEKDSRLAMYLPNKGIYTHNEVYLRRYIAILEPNHNEMKARDVIYQIRMATGVKEKTELPYLIPVNNGVFNLETKKLEPFTPDYVFTTKIVTDYVEHPTSPDLDGWNVDQWLRDLASGEEALITLLWQVLHDSMNGNFSRRKSIWLYSDGNSGKGTFQALIQSLVGLENVATLTLPQFSDRFSLPMLDGKTVCIGDDVPAGIYIDDSSNFNRVITGESLTVEQKYKESYSKIFNLGVIQSTNGLPRIHNKTNGTYRRLLIVEFKQQFTPETDNWKIKDEYVHNTDVLQYVLNKAIHMDFDAFIVPESSQRLMGIYQLDNDPVRDFKVSVFDEFKSTRIPKHVVYHYYVDFCEENHYKVMSARHFYNAFERLLDKDWVKKVSRLSGMFKEYPLPFFADEKVRKELEDKDKTHRCYVNIRLDLVS